MTKPVIIYTILPSQPSAHLFEVSCLIQQPDPKGQCIWMPSWIPGSYMIRDFAKNMVSLSASNSQGSVAVTKLDKQTWQCAPCSGPLTISYTVYAYDLSVRSAHLDTTHAYFNGSSVFVAVQGQEELPIHVNIQKPKHDCAKNWRIATSLTRVNADLFSPGTYSAQNYDELIDHPVEMAAFDEIEFDVHGTPHHIVITGKHHADLDRLAQDIQRICQQQVSVFGELPQMERYIFLLLVVGEGYGGLEHRNSSSLICSRKDLPIKNMTSPADGYTILMGLFSHEYFHTWNVKRIKPSEFIPYALKKESHTKQLWAFEGITSYYDDLGLVRSGVIDEKNYLTLLGKNITRVMRGSGRLKQSLRDSSFDAWTKFYKQDENAPNAIVSYYAKGAMFALALDLKIRSLTDNTQKLDDVMRRLWKEYGKPGKGIEDNTIQSIAEDICKQPLTDFFSQYLDGTDDLPLPILLTSMGVELKSRIAESLEDAGGTPAKAANNTPTFNLGARFIADPAGVRIQQVLDNGDVQRAGLAAYDVILAVNGLKASKDNLAVLLNQYCAGDKLDIHAFRRDELMTFNLELSPAPEDTWYMQLNDDDIARRHRQDWLSTGG